MSYLFKCRETGDVLMLQADGDALLHIIGRAAAARGLIDAAALPAAIAAIESAVATENTALAPAAQDRLPPEPDCPAPGELSLRQRSWPLLQMMKSAQASATGVSWGL